MMWYSIVDATAAVLIAQNSCGDLGESHLSEKKQRQDVHM